MNFRTLPCDLRNLRRSSRNGHGRCQAGGKLLVSFAVFPSREEAETYGSFQFCDDIAENYFLPLAERFTPAEIRQHGFLRKLLRRLKRGEAATPIRHSYWIHGSIALSGVRNRRLYHYEAVLNELLFRLRKKLH